MRKYANQAEPDPEIFLRKYTPFFFGGGANANNATHRGTAPEKIQENGVTHLHRAGRLVRR